MDYDISRYEQNRNGGNRSNGEDYGDGGKKAPSRLSQVQQLMMESKERAGSAGNEPIPKITLVRFARSGGSGGQNVNKVKAKVDMRFYVKKSYWLSERVREKIVQILELAAVLPALAVCVVPQNRRSTQPRKV